MICGAVRWVRCIPCGAHVITSLDWSRIARHADHRNGGEGSQHAGAPEGQWPAVLGESPGRPDLLALTYSPSAGGEAVVDSESVPGVGSGVVVVSVEPESVSDDSGGDVGGGAAVTVRTGDCDARA